jgi:putative transposase
MQKLGTGYTMYFNKTNERVGPLFQGVFKSVLIEIEEQLKWLLVYINVINPGQLIESGLKENGIGDLEKVLGFAEEYPWGTHQEYLGIRDSFIIDKGVLGDIFSNHENYRDFVRSALAERKLNDISNLFLE